MNENQNVVIKFSFTDSFGNKSKLQKTLTPDCVGDTSELDLLLDNFKLFLIAAGYSQEQVNGIQRAEPEKE